MDAYTVCPLVPTVVGGNVPTKAVNENTAG